MDELDHLLMPPPAPPIFSKKRPRSITIYSEEEAYGPSRSRSTSCISLLNGQLPAHGLNSHPSPSENNTCVTPTPKYVCAQSRRAFRSLQPTDTCIKSLASSMTGEFQLDCPNDTTTIAVGTIHTSTLTDNSDYIEALDTNLDPYTTTVLPCVSQNLKSCTLDETQHHPSLSEAYNDSTHFPSSDEPCSSLSQGEVMCNKEDDIPKTRDFNDIPKITTRFADIIGHGGAKLRLEEAILPLALPPSLVNSVLTGLRSAPASILLYGPPGCGKSKLAKAVAGEAQAAFISVGPSDILSKYVGESEASVREIFRYARERAMKMHSRCAVLFFDEIDALGQSRGCGNGDRGMASGGETSSRRILAELLIQLSKNYNEDPMDECVKDKIVRRSDEDFQQGHGLQSTDQYRSTIDDSHESNIRRNSETVERQVITPTATDMTFKRTSNGDPHQYSEIDWTDVECEIKPRIIVIAATNRPDDCDPALLRRFHVRILVGPPTKRDRQKIIHRLLSGVDHSLSDNDLLQIAIATEGFSGSDLESLTREAVMTPIRECLQKAARLKASTRRDNARGGFDSNPKNEIQEGDTLGDRAARDALLTGFKSLRSVHIQDFEQAMSFWLGEDDFQFLGGTSGAKRKALHYDSDSSSE